MSTELDTLAEATAPAFDPKDPDEVVDLEVDFADLTADIATRAIEVSVVAGADTAPATLLSGAVGGTGTAVRQRVTGGRAGTTYLLRFKATNAAGLTFVEPRRLLVRRRG